MLGPRRPRVPAELAARIDAERGDVPFERWVRRALEQALGATKEPASRDLAGPGSVPSSEGVRPAAPARASGSLTPRETEAMRNIAEAPVLFRAPCCDFTAPSPNAVCRAHGRKVRSV